MRARSTLAALLLLPAIAGAQRGSSPRAWFGIEEGIGIVGVQGLTFKGGSAHVPTATLGLLMREGLGIELGVMTPRELLVESRQADPRPTGVNFDLATLSIARLSGRGGELTTSSIGVAAIRPLGESTITAAVVASAVGDVHQTRLGALTLGARGWYAPNARGTTIWTASLNVGWRVH